MQLAKVVSFEGIDLSGKSVQARLFHERLKKENVPSILLRDPGATRISERIRSILLDNELQEMSSWTELLLYEAARAQMVEEAIKPALQAGTLVICDRFYDSTTAYQGYGRGLDLELVTQANKIGACGLVPDLTYLIDLEPEVALQRKHKLRKQDRLEAEGIEFQRRVREGYLHLAKEESQRVRLIDGNRDIQQIHEQVWREFLHRFNNELHQSF